LRDNISEHICGLKMPAHLKSAGCRKAVSPYERLSGSLVADPSALMSIGWTPPLATPAGLAGLMQANGM